MPGLPWKSNCIYSPTFDLVLGFGAPYLPVFIELVLWTTDDELLFVLGDFGIHLSTHSRHGYFSYRGTQRCIPQLNQVRGWLGHVTVPEYDTVHSPPRHIDGLQTDKKQGQARRAALTTFVFCPPPLRSFWIDPALQVRMNLGLCLHAYFGGHIT